MSSMIKVAAFSGSLRKGSYNSAVLRACKQLVPDDVSLEILDIKLIPLYNEDLRVDSDPEAVIEFKRDLANAEAILIAAHEYNYSMPGVLKNAIDWASRPSETSPMLSKPLAIVSCGGRFGALRSAVHLAQVAAYLDMHLLHKPEVIIPRVWDKFDDHGTLIDDELRERLRLMLVKYKEWILRLR